MCATKGGRRTRDGRGRGRVGFGPYIIGLIRQELYTGRALVHTFCLSSLVLVHNLGWQDASGQAGLLLFLSNGARVNPSYIHPFVGSTRLGMISFDWLINMFGLKKEFRKTKFSRLHDCGWVCLGRINSNDLLGSMGLIMHNNLT